MLLAIEIFLGTGSSSAGYHIDEAVGMFVDFTDTGFAGFGGDEHNDTDIVTVGNRFIRFFVIFEGKIGNNNAVDATFYTFLTESLEPEFHDRVEIAHQNEGNTDIATDIAELLKQIRSDIPLRRARVAASWITMPSAIGSLKGIPISIEWTPLRSRVRMTSAVPSRVGQPAQK